MYTTAVFGEPAPTPTDPAEKLSELLKLGLDPFAGPLENSDLKHLLRRTLCGVADIDLIAYEKESSLEGLLNKLLAIPPAQPPPIVNYTDGKDIKEPKVQDGQTWIHEEWNDNVEYYRLLSLKIWWLDHMLYDQTIFEKMVLFWHNHIPVEMVGVFHARQGYDYLMTIRKNALGNFKQLIKELTLDPMMLHYLNGNSNDKAAPDENYARELQELFCIGKGPNAKFTEDDVKSAARVLTGWKSDYLKPKLYWAPRSHDTDDKKFSSFYGNRVIKGKLGMEGEQELDELIDMIVTHPECALYICRKLYRYFVYPDISPTTETNIIIPLAKIFRDNNYEILPVLKALLSSQHFYDPLIRMAVIKSPIDYAIGANRHFKMGFPQATADYKKKFQAQMIMYYFLNTFQQDVGDPPNVSGWPAYYQFPQFDKSWISTYTIQQRGHHSELLVWYGYQMGDKIATIDWPAYVNLFARAADPNFLIEDVLATLLDTPIDASVKRHLKIILLSGQQSDFYWTNAWNEFKFSPANLMARNTVEVRLKPFFQYILQMEEYQLL